MFVEEIKTGNPYRQDYLDSIHRLIKERQAYADKERERHFREMIDNTEKYREEFKKMLGWPLTETNNEISNGKRTLVSSENGINIYRVQIAVPYGLDFYGILFEHDSPEKKPLIIAQHGGLGTPELCSGMLADGPGTYHEMVTGPLKLGMNVFSPQLLLWEKEKYGIDYDRNDADAKLKQLGSSITAIEVFCIIKSIDYLSTLSSIDTEKIGMVGLSYGGFYTLFTTAAEPRIKAAIACAQYNNRYKYSWVDWTWYNAGFQFTDNEVASLIYPRYLCLEVGNQDELFDVELAKQEFEKLCKMTNDLSWIDFRVFDGIHEFYPSDEDLKKLKAKLYEEK